MPDFDVFDVFDVIVIGGGLSGGLPAAAYLQKAGYNPADVDAVAGLLHAAQGNSKLEKLMSVPAPK